MKVFPRLVICYTDFKPSEQIMANVGTEQSQEFWSTEIAWVHIEEKPALRFAQVS